MEKACVFRKHHVEHFVKWHGCGVSRVILVSCGFFIFFFFTKVISHLSLKFFCVKIEKKPWVNVCIVLFLYESVAVVVSNDINRKSKRVWGCLRKRKSGWKGKTDNLDVFILLLYHRKKALWYMLYEPCVTRVLLETDEWWKSCVAKATRSHTSTCFICLCEYLCGWVWSSLS